MEEQFQTPPIKQSSAQSPSAPADGGQKKGIIAGAIIVLLIVAGIIYYYGLTAEQEPVTQEQAEQIRKEIAEEPDAAAESLRQQSESDVVNDIEQDLSATEFGNIDKELGDINTELQF